MASPHEPWIRDRFRAIAEIDDVQVLSDELLERIDTFGDFVEYRALVRRLIALPGGVEALYQLAWSLPKNKARSAALSGLWAAEHGKHVSTLQGDTTGIASLNVPVDPETSQNAARRLRDLVAEALDDADRFQAVLTFAQSDMYLGPEGSSVSQLTTLLAESRIRLTRPLIREFRLLIEQAAPELRYQEFLAAHSVFLDPLAAEVIDRHRLGDDLITDYVVRRHDGRYLIVEIEKPYDKIFTRNGDFASGLTHAFRQVLDFLGWIDANVSYARTKLPGIESPDGLVIVGQRNGLSHEEQDKLRRFCANSRRIEVLTFDDLATRAEVLYDSLHYTPISPLGRLEGEPPGSQ
jgi:hypothetical protein